MGNTQLKDTRHKFQVINIKLQTTKEGEAKNKAYSDLIKKLTNEKLHSSVAENSHMIIYSCYDRATPNTQIKYQYGDLGKGIYFEEDVINTINIEKSQGDRKITDKNEILSPKTAEYIFIPQIHRLVFINNEGISINNIHKFLSDSLQKVKDQNDHVEVEIVKDPKITNEILKAYAIHSLNYTISYTNDDYLEASDRLLDRRLKQIYAGKLNVNIEADHHGFLNTSKPDELIEGGIKLAEQNGQVKQAVITQNEGEGKIVLSNMERPRYFDVLANEEDYKQMIVEKMIKIFSKNI